MPVPRVSVRNSVRKPISPRDGTRNSIRTHPVPWLVICSMAPLRAAMSWVTAPRNSSGMSTVSRSIGSWTLPSTILVTTCGLPTVSSNPSRRICSTRMAKASSPRPCTSQVSGRSVGRTRMETLPTSSRSIRSLTRRAVTLAPRTRPAIGEVLVPIVIEIAGSSTVMSGRGRGSSRSARVSPIMMSSMPAMAMMSPGPALLSGSRGLRSRPSVMSSSVTLTRCTLPSRRHQATC